MHVGLNLCLCILPWLFFLTSLLSPSFFFVWISFSPSLLFLSSRCPHRHAADTTATVVDLLPSVTTNSDPGTDSPASDSTTLTSSTAPAADPKAAPKPTPQSSTPKPSVTSPQAAPAAVAPLVDLSDTPSSQTSKSLEAPQPSDSTPADLAKADGQRPVEPAIPPQSKDSQVQGGAHQTTDSDLAKDTVGKPSSESSSTRSAPNQDEYGHLWMLSCVCVPVLNHLHFLTCVLHHSPSSTYNSLTFFSLLNVLSEFHQVPPASSVWAYSLERWLGTLRQLVRVYLHLSKKLLRDGVSKHTSFLNV